ncbi:MAG: SLBB domain-containing protein [Candidatus Delongbacteria bacterium]|nr:SLBB domain-containing protein [Candidatus Delongbacteria bacterium]
MKKIIIIFVLILSFVCFSQNEELLKMYEKVTGKDLSTEIEKLKNKDPEFKNLKEKVQIDSISIKPEITTNDTVTEVKDTYFEKYVNGTLIDPYSSKLKQFSIDFSAVKTTMNFNKKIPDSYILSSGDEFIIDIWGAMDKNYVVQVTNENYIIIPQIGKIDISGLNYSQAKKTISDKLGSISGINFTVRLSDVKPISIFVVGNVAKPGIYNVSPFSSIFEILALAGGVLPEGSLRNIGLIPENGGSSIMDLYSLMFFGERVDHILQSNETIFVPLIGEQVAVAGNVKREGIYEYKKGERLNNILKISGLTPFSDTSRIEIEGLDKKGRSLVESVALENNPVMKDGDIVRVFSTLVYNSDYVYLKGNFRHNKKIQYKKDMTLGNVISSNEILKENTNLDYGNIIRKNGMGQRDLLLNFSPAKVLKNEGDDNIVILPRDTIEVFNLDSISFLPTVTISGEVNKAGNYKYTSDMTVNTLIGYAGGLAINGDVNSNLVIRNNGEKGYSYFTDVDPSSFNLKNDDRLHIFNYNTNNPMQYVHVYGHVKNNGKFIHSSNMTVSDLLKLAGGYTFDAQTDSMEVVSGINRDNKSLKTKIISSKDVDTVKLNVNDILFVRKIKDYAKVNYVKIYGEVLFPGTYALRESEEFSDLLERCGGFTSSAQIKSTQIFREEVKRQQSQKIRELKEELNNKLKMKMILSGEANLASALNIDKFDSLETSGRVILDIDEKGNHEKFYFMDQDSIFVPSISRTILVMGEVYQQTAITFNESNSEVEYYLDKVGGITDTGDDDNIYVIKSNGELIKEKGWFDNILSYDLEPGDIIYVPYDYEKIDYFELTKDITTILYQLSLSAATVYTITK